ncbi:hydroxylamine reductase, partial [Candidatus Bathyarchaeota archaeon]|nr:hydroxylamine reductase [Candidatus Bathyarchaeota archaeon]
MFCYQCEQTAQGKGCTILGVCGKSPDVAVLQDLLIYVLKGLSLYAVEGRTIGVNDAETNKFVCEALFATLTNVNFDPERIKSMIEETVQRRESLRKKVKAAGGEVREAEGPATFVPDKTIEGLVKQGERVGILSDQGTDPDVHSLVWTLTYGLKGIAAYADHASILGKEDDAVFKFLEEGLVATLNKNASLEEMLNLVLKAGQVNLRAMELLDAGNTGAYGDPVPTTVPLGVKKGKAILVSGHDLKDLELILEQSEGKGIYVYTHGEMLPTHGYPKLKCYSHFYGHYGTAWQNQKKEFAEFPGAIVMTTNCIQQPQDTYKRNIFTTGMAGWPGIMHIKDKDFTPVIEKALVLPGFTSDNDKGSVTVGFGHATVMGVAGKVVDLVKSGKIRHFFLVGGCDGSKPARSYYSEFVEKVPNDCIVLTLACGKFKFFDKKLGNIEGIPRLMDIGQCNDAYSAIQIAVALSKAFNIGVNELPLSLILSWYEQKA